jgi:uncharacterized membrane protein
MSEAREQEHVATADPMAYNVEAIARLELKGLHQRSMGEKVSDFFVSLMGSMPFLVLHVLFFTAWFSINLGAIPGVEPFDPFPFGILTLIVSAEGVFLAIFILISQNRMTRQSDKRAHLDLQVSMLSEQEMTMMLRMQQRLCEHLGVEVDNVREEAQRLMDQTDVNRLVDELEEKLPE